MRVRANCPNSPQDDWTGARVLWCYVWQVTFAGLWLRAPWPDVPFLRGHYFEFRIGWRLVPRDVRGVPTWRGTRWPLCLWTRSR